MLQFFYGFSPVPKYTGDIRTAVLPKVIRADTNFVQEMAIVFNKKMRFHDTFVEELERSK